jgi:hypothetical protein
MCTRAQISSAQGFLIYLAKGICIIIRQQCVYTIYNDSLLFENIKRYTDVKSGVQLVGFSVIKVKFSFDCQMTGGWPAAVGVYVHTWLVGTIVIT